MPTPKRHETWAFPISVEKKKKKRDTKWFSQADPHLAVAPAMTEVEVIDLY
jgi:hypothetical protein